jgi:hypothetical protein
MQQTQKILAAARQRRPAAAGPAPGPRAAVKKPGTTTLRKNEVKLDHTRHPGAKFGVKQGRLKHWADEGDEDRW